MPAKYPLRKDSTPDPPPASQKSISRASNRAPKVFTFREGGLDSRLRDRDRDRDRAKLGAALAVYRRNARKISIDEFADPYRLMGPR
jgi:hypothetical protein